jgi:hypothetical protein
VLVFHCYDKIPEVRSGTKDLFALTISEVSVLGNLGLVISGPMVRQSVMAEGSGRPKQPGSNTRLWDGTGDKVHPSSTCPQVAYFFQPGPTSWLPPPANTAKLHQ